MGYIKVVVADLIAIMFSPFMVIMNFILVLPIYSQHIYLQFKYIVISGYSDIAIGSARILGYELMENFKKPYFSKSITEFWRRWHISLSTWLRDYLYISRRE